MNLGGILDRGVQVFRARYIVFFELGFIQGLAAFAYRVASVHPKPITSGDATNAGLVFLSYTASFVTWLATVFLGAVVPAAICFAASKVNLSEPVTIQGAFRAFTSKFWRLFGLSILQGIFAGWPLIIAGISVAVIWAAAPSSRGDWVILAVIFILGGVPSVALYTRYALAYPATAIEGVTAQVAIDRSVSLSEGGRWRIFWGIVVPLVPSLFLTVGLVGLVGSLKSGIAFLFNDPLLVAGIDGIVALIAAVVFTPYSYIVLTLLYYDQRVRKEGFDIERMMQAAGLDESLAMVAGDNAIRAGGTGESLA
jgi:hypothetical protein